MMKMLLFLKFVTLFMRAIFRTMQLMSEIFQKIAMWLLTFKFIVLTKPRPLMKMTTYKQSTTSQYSRQIRNWSPAPSMRSIMKVKAQSCHMLTTMIEVTLVNKILML